MSGEWKNLFCINDENLYELVFTRKLHKYTKLVMYVANKINIYRRSTFHASTNCEKRV